jgi:hypothetical protein
MASTAKQGWGKTHKKSRTASGRATTSTKGDSASSGSVQSGRHTPPIDRREKVSPKWLGVLIIAMFGLGVLIVILNYAGLLPGGVNNAWLIAAIGSIFVGLLLATRYH